MNNNVLAQGQLGVLGNVIVYQNNTVLGNEYVAGNAYVNSGITVGDTSNGAGVTMISSGSTLDISGNLLVNGTTSLTGAVNVANTLSTNSGFAVDLSGNVNVSRNLEVKNNALFDNNASVVGALSAATFSTNLGFSVDASANLTAPANGTINSLYVPGTTATNNITALQNSAVIGGEYVGGNVYANGGVTLGDTYNGTGVKLITTIDSSLNNIVSLNNCPNPTTSSKTTTHNLPIYINGTVYYILLSSTT
jgi:hypothetical protein